MNESILYQPSNDSFKQIERNILPLFISPIYSCIIQRWRLLQAFTDSCHIDHSTPIYLVLFFFRSLLEWIMQCKANTKLYMWYHRTMLEVSHNYVPYFHWLRPLSFHLRPKELQMSVSTYKHQVQSHILILTRHEKWPFNGQYVWMTCKTPL